jgi:SAM-dependent methyltransferase
MHNRSSHIILPTSKYYEAAVRRESKTWGREYTLSERRSIEYAYPSIAAYRNETITGSSEKTWMDLLKECYGGFEKALSLGVGSGWIEETLIERELVSSLELSDLSSTAVQYVSDRLKKLDKKVKVQVQVQDANFVWLEPECYDLIICHSILHHIINLEHLLGQINGALKKTGVLVVDEFIGPSRFQWPKTVRNVVNRTVRSLSGGSGFRPMTSPERAVMAMTSPFESIRSSELASLLESQFHGHIILERRFMGFLYPAIWTLNFDNWQNLSLAETVEKCIDLDKAFSLSRELPPCFLFGLYCKSENKIPASVPLTAQDIRRLLNPYSTASPLRLAKWLISPILARLGLRDRG